MGKAIFLSKYLNELSKKKKKLPKSRKQLSTKAHALFKPLKRCSSIVWSSSAIIISPRTSFHFSDRYALCNHKILRFYAYEFGLREGHFIYELYDFGSHSWKVLDVEPNFTIDYHQRRASLKGNTYFFGHGRMGDFEEDDDLDDFLLCFDFTTETFGPRLPLPFHSCFGETVTVSSVTQEKLVVLYQRPEDIELLEVWVTTEISPNLVSWSMFLKVDMKPLTGFQFHYEGGSFFVDEEKKAVVVFDQRRTQ